MVVVFTLVPKDQLKEEQKEQIAKTDVDDDVD